MTIDNDAARAARRARIEAALARYPHLTPEGLAELARYFDQEASSLDIALIASNEAIASPYRAFRAEHIDPLTRRDWVRGITFALAVTAIVVGILWRAF